MDKKEEENKKMPEDPVEEKPTGEGEIQEKAEEAVEEQKSDKSEEKDEVKETETQDKKPEEAEEKSAEEVKEEKPKKDKKEEQKVDKKSEQTKKEKKKKSDPEHDDDFKYIVRIANTDIDGDKKIIHGLTSIKGIGRHMSVLIAEHVDIDLNTKLGNLTDSQIENIKNTIEEVIEKAPKWMLNHRKDYETGEDLHLIGPDIDMKLRDEINIKKKIRCYRGIRHERGLPVRGQRTRANNRTGLTLGVSKKRPQK